MLFIMCAVIVVGLAAWLAIVALAQRRPAPRGDDAEIRRGPVQGGIHTGGGRSVAPHRDAVVVPGQDPEESSVPDRPGRPGEGSGNPMDL
jgi:hypothetical protein